MVAGCCSANGWEIALPDDSVGELPTWTRRSCIRSPRRRRKSTKDSSNSDCAADSIACSVAPYHSHRSVASPRRRWFPTSFAARGDGGNAWLAIPGTSRTRRRREHQRTSRRLPLGSPIALRHAQLPPIGPRRPFFQQRRRLRTFFVRLAEGSLTAVGLALARYGRRAQLLVVCPPVAPGAPVPGRGRLRHPRVVLATATLQRRAAV